MTWTVQHRMRRAPAVIVLSVLGLLVPVVTVGVAQAQGGGGTAKPPPGAVAPFVEPTLGQPVVGQQPFTGNLANLHGFFALGFVQDATVDLPDANGKDVNCPNTVKPTNFGGTVTINNVKIVVPCNLTIQMPANTFTWADFVNGGPSVTLNNATGPTPAPSFEIQVVGNIVTGKRIAALMFFSQQAANTGTGYVSAINYADGSFTVDTGVGNAPAKVQINDPKIHGLLDIAGNDTGRQSAGQSPDARLSIDQANPTVKASSGYPMCIPRVAPGADPAVETDPLCPQKNRPLAANGCRNFTQAGVAPPKSGELSAPAVGQVYCSQFVMKDPNAVSGVGVRVPTDPDSRQQVPFEVGDFVTFSGTLFGQGATSYTSAHTVEAHVGVYTQPGSKPSYLSIDSAGIGTADPLAIAVNGVAQETQDRLVLEAHTTDVQSPVDIYLTDISPTTGKVRNRWATPQAMTGENNGPLQADNVTPIGGGITTQNTGPQPTRARIRATKAPLGLLSNPTRTLRVSNRVTCVPNAPIGNNPDPTATTPVDLCLNNLATNANGLQAGEYTAPMFNFIFPENVKPGDVIVPNDFWHLGFLRFGEGANPLTPTVGALEPTPW